MSYPPPAQSPLLPYTDRPTSPGTPGFAGRDASSPYLSESGSFAQTSMDGQSMLGLTNHVRQRSYQDDKEEEEGATALGGASGAKGPSEGGFWARIWSRGKRWIVLGVVLLMIIIVIAAAVPAAMNKSNNSKSEVALVADGKGSSSTSSSSQASSTRASSSTTLSSSTSSAAPTPTGRPSWGGDESTVYAEDGSTFTYNNTFGGFWNAVPFNNSARPQAHSKALDEEWDYDIDTMRGVNLGGWLTIEPFIVPGLFEPFNSNTDSRDDVNLAIDEWTLCEQLGSNLAAVLTEHYETFITEKDFAEIAGAGLNWVRLPIPFWIIETWDDEPYLANVGWTYVLKAIGWARKYGLRINLDLHAVPGSQNGYNHSGKLGSINFMAGVMGIANAQRTLDIIRTITQFISQPEYLTVVGMFSILNEPYGPSIGVDEMRHFYLETYNMIREITGLGAGKGPFIAFHDVFAPQNDVADEDFDVAAGGWNGFLPGMDRVSLDTHPYLCFGAPNNDGLAFQATKPCTYFGAKMNITTANFGLSIAGEWSLAINDCGKWLNNVGNGQRFEGTHYDLGTGQRTFERVGDCAVWTDYENYTDEIKQGLMNVAMAHMDAFRHFMFWTWKTGYSQDLGRIANPFWNYQLGLRNGWIPLDPRSATGICPSLVAAEAGVTMPNFPAPPLSAWMTGGAGAGTILDTAMEAQFTAWPPTTLGTLPVSNLPTYTPTGSVVTMGASRPTSFPQGFATAAPNVGDGWFNGADERGWYTKIEGCTYPDAWSGAGLPAPSSRCTGPAARMKRTASPSAPSPPSPTTPPPARRSA